MTVDKWDVRNSGSMSKFDYLRLEREFAEAVERRRQIDQDKRQRNAESARRSRQRKIEKLDRLNRTVQGLVQEKDVLKVYLNTLQNERDNLAIENELLNEKVSKLEEMVAGIYIKI